MIMYELFPTLAFENFENNFFFEFSIYIFTWRQNSSKKINTTNLGFFWIPCLEFKSLP